MLNVTFERSTEADAEALTRVQVAAFHSDAVAYPGVEVGGPPGYDSVDAVREKIRDCVSYTIRRVDGDTDGERIIGGMVVFDRSAEGRGEMHVDLLYVDPAYHNLGIGRRAMRFLEEAHPARVWTLDTPAYAVRNQHFYEGLGYERVAERLVDGLALIAYEKHGAGGGGD